MSIDLIALLTFLAIVALVGIALSTTFRAQHPEHAAQRAIRQLPLKARAVASPSAVDFDSWFARTLFLSGFDISPMTATFVILLLGFSLGAVVWVTGGNAILAGTATLVGGLLGIAVLLATKSIRMHKFQNQLPGALELLARAVRAGESFDQAMSLVGQSAPEPVAVEFRRCARHLQMGLSVSAATEALFQRMSLVDVRIFGTTVTVHRSAGGHLAETLERLSRVIRDRLAYRRQLRAITGAGRLSAILISALGPILFVYLFCFQADYGETLWKDPLGRAMLAFAGLSELIGLLWVARLLRADY